ncbi:hypothetical protein EVAR_11986_1 [Eumeta japonica]|uniref:Reverse transcriptase domain-containing protein n=1 Tax=Eumeta variegata TaxID=151549 RepID=A0A4C1U4R0_EUMVA|nr:hypothetical protein EVAR_11986_1 [Eumeta japonica]
MCVLRIDVLSVKYLLYADDQVIPSPQVCRLQEMVNKMNDSVKKRDMKVNVDKTDRRSVFTNDGKHDRDIERRVNVGNKLNGALLVIMNSKSVSRQARLAIHGALIPMLMYGNENWA